MRTSENEERVREAGVAFWCRISATTLSTLRQRVTKSTVACVDGMCSFVTNVAWSFGWSEQSDSSLQTRGLLEEVAIGVSDCYYCHYYCHYYCYYNYYYYFLN